MNSKIVSQLKTLTRNLGSRLRKAINRVTGNSDLIDFTNVVPTSGRKITETRQPPSIFGKVSNINIPILKPTIVTTTPDKLPNVIQKTTEKVIEWGEWLKNADEAIEKHNSKNETKNEIMDMFDKPSKSRHIKPTFTQRAKAIKKYTRSYEIGLTNKQDPLIQLQNTSLVIEDNLSKILTEMKGFKFNEMLKITFNKQVGDESIEKTAYFFAKVQTVTNEIEIVESLQMTKEQIMNRIQQWISEGSGWTIQSVDGHYINVVKYKPLKGSSYILLPKELRNSAKGLINIKNKDNECFRWCHIRHLNPQDNHPERIKKTDKQYVEKLDYTDIEFPVTVKHYKRIEKQNSINVNVFGYEEKQPFPIYVSKEKHQDHMELLLMTKGENMHYVLMKDFNKFMYNQTKHGNKKHFCMHCLQCFSREDVLTEHIPNCIAINGEQAIKMPEEGDEVHFRNHHKQLPAPFVIYADFEAITEKVDSCQPSDKKSYTEANQKHTDCGYGYKVVCCYDDKYSKPVQIYRGENAVYKFMENMLEEVDWCKQTMKKHFNKPLEMTEEDEVDFQKATKCHICDRQYQGDVVDIEDIEDIDSNTEIRVRDHCHITGEFRGSAHQDCNLKLQINPDKIKIPVFFHNLRGYDSHFIMQQIGEIAKKHAYTNKRGEECHMNINCIPNNMEKYMAFMLGKHLTFLDSMQFMLFGLKKLVENLPTDKFKYTDEEFQGEELKLVKRKGVYPYDHMDSFQKFEETELPTQEQFYNLLNDESISDEDYQHAQNVWKKFNMKSMGDYHDVYLKVDVLLLADVFENFRKTCLQYYRLDPCYYFTSPGLSWDAMLKMTNIRLNLISDVDMYQFVEKGMRGGVSYIANRFGEANNKYMTEYDETAPEKHIMYLDANNLYGWAMSQYLPTGGFKWLDVNDFILLDDYTDTNDKGLILEVDLEYPDELHDLHNDYPLAPEKLNVTGDMLSTYCKEIANKFNMSSGLVKKLIPTLGYKEKYVLHYRNLQLYLDLGMKLRKVHRVLEFNQSPWLKEYIDFNTSKRTNAKNSFEKDFFKLMNNSVFGKTMENLRKRVDVRLVTDEKKLFKLTSKPTYVSCKIFNEDLVAIHKIKETLTLNRPAYVGMCILDLSKTLMYDFHYNYIKSKYGDKAKLLFTDTDSLMYEIQTDDVYKDLFVDKDKFDNSDYPEDSPFYFGDNKKVIGKFKDEAAGIPITEFVGLKSKMYSYIKDNGEGGKTAKGVKKNVIRNVMTHINYNNVLMNNTQMRHKMRCIRSVKHQLGTYEINKISLSCFDDKRYIHDNGITSYAYSHYMINAPTLPTIEEE